MRYGEDVAGLVYYQLFEEGREIFCAAIALRPCVGACACTRVATDIQAGVGGTGLMKEKIRIADDVIAMKQVELDEQLRLGKSFEIIMCNINAVKVGGS